MRSTGGTPRVGILGRDAGQGALLRDILLASLPAARAEVLGGPERAEPPDAEVLVLDSVVDGQPGLEVLRRLRSVGFQGAVVLVMDEADPLIAERAAQIGACRNVVRRDAAHALPAAVADIVAELGGAAAGDPLRQALHRTRRLIAAGEIALRLQHAMNNPLAALLAEAQLLEMEPLAEEHRAAVRRMVELCRRLVSLVRQLDGVAGSREPMEGKEERS